MSKNRHARGRALTAGLSGEQPFFGFPSESDCEAPSKQGSRVLQPFTTSDDGQSVKARRSRDRLPQPRLSPSFSSRGLHALAKFVQASPSLQTPATSPVSPLKWAQDESTFPHAMNPTATS